MKHTMDDFWRMIWEHRVCAILMMCQLEEKGKVGDDVMSSIGSNDVIVLLVTSFFSLMSLVLVSYLVIYVWEIDN